MALTKTRSRTQTTLDKLAQLLANINGELGFVKGLPEESGEPLDVLNTRLAQLQHDRRMVCITL